MDGNLSMWSIFGKAMTWNLTRAESRQSLNAQGPRKSRNIGTSSAALF